MNKDNRKRTLMTLSVLVALAGWTHARADEKGKPAKPDKAEPRCPVSGEKIDKEVHIDADAGRVYFCCGHCIADYKADPAKYAPAVHAQQMLMGPPVIQVACPVSGRTPDKAVSLDHYGQTIYFCCNRCPAKFKENPGEYLSNFARAFTTQTQCPVSGKDINPAASLALADAGRVYFCCERCPSKFEADRYEYGAKLPDFYICPMKECKDPGALKPGECPKCGMDRRNIGLSTKKTKEVKEVEKIHDPHHGHNH
jgi:YHS domain-containing protein